MSRVLNSFNGRNFLPVGSRQACPLPDKTSLSMITARSFSIYMLCKRSIMFRADTMTAIIPRTILFNPELANLPITFLDEVRKTSAKIVHGS